MVLPDFPLPSLGLPLPVKAFMDEMKLTTIYNDPLAPWAVTWLQAKTLEEATSLMEEWLRGKWPCNPFTLGFPAPEVQEVGDVLIHLNRQGFLTKGGQAAIKTRHLWRRACVTGWLRPEGAHKLSDALQGSGLFTTIVGPSAPVLNLPHQAPTLFQDRFRIELTARERKRFQEGTAHTRGEKVKGDHWRYKVGYPCYHAGLSQELEEDLDKKCLWVMVADPQWGRRYTLWREVAKAL